MNITVKNTIEAPIDQVWEVMGNQFGHADRWSSNFITSAPGGNKKFDGIDYSLRNTTTERSNTIQELTSFDPSTFSLTYVITKGAPEIAKAAGASWSLSLTSQQQTEVIMEFYLEPIKALPEEMEQKIRGGLEAAAYLLTKELKHYVETGQALDKASTNSNPQNR